MAREHLSVELKDTEWRVLERLQQKYLICLSIDVLFFVDIYSVEMGTQDEHDDRRSKRCLGIVAWLWEKFKFVGTIAEFLCIERLVKIAVERRESKRETTNRL